MHSPIGKINTSPSKSLSFKRIAGEELQEILRESAYGHHGVGWGRALWRRWPFSQHKGDEAIVGQEGLVGLGSSALHSHQGHDGNMTVPFDGTMSSNEKEEGV